MEQKKYQGYYLDKFINNTEERLPRQIPENLKPFDINFWEEESRNFALATSMENFLKHITITPKKYGSIGDDCNLHQIEKDKWTKVVINDYFHCLLKPTKIISYEDEAQWQEFAVYRAGDKVKIYIRVNECICCGSPLLEGLQIIEGSLS